MMNLTDYETPADERYAPRPRAAQEVAAQKRQRPTHDTEPITPIQLSSPARRYVPFGIGAIVLIVAILATQQQFDRAPSPLAITPGPSTAAFLAAPTAAPAPTSAPMAAPRTIPAYAAPDGLLLGQIEEDRQITPVAHYGSGWIQANVAGSGLVWLRASDLPDLALTGPDLAPVAAQTQGRGLTVNNEWTPPEVTPAPAKGSKPADDRAARHAAAVARDQPHGQKGP